MTAVDLAWHLDRKVFAQTISFIFQCFLILALGTQGPSWLTEGPQRAKGFSDRLPVCDHSQWHGASLPPMWEKRQGKWRHNSQFTLHVPAVQHPPYQALRLWSSSYLEIVNVYRESKSLNSLFNTITTYKKDGTRRVYIMYVYIYIYIYICTIIYIIIYIYHWHSQLCWCTRWDLSIRTWHLQHRLLFLGHQVRLPRGRPRGGSDGVFNSQPETSTWQPQHQTKHEGYQLQDQFRQSQYWIWETKNHNIFNWLGFWPPYISYICACWFGNIFNVGKKKQLQHSNVQNHDPIVMSKNFRPKNVEKQRQMNMLHHVAQSCDSRVGQVSSTVWEIAGPPAACRLPSENPGSMGAGRCFRLLINRRSSFLLTVPAKGSFQRAVANRHVQHNHHYNRYYNRYYHLYYNL